MDSPTPNESDMRDGGYCLGYFRGFGDLNAMVGSSVCLDRASTGTVIRVYVAYMEKNPKYLDDAMVIGVIYALKDGYPCPAQKN
jgi:Rap1a immunity proteins